MEETIARLVQGFIAFGLAYTVALWVALVLWTWRDIAARSDSALVQIVSTLVVALFFAPGAVIYLMLRPRETLDEAYQRSVAEEYLIQDLEEFPACPACRRPIRDDYVFCPHCRVELRRPCAGCGRLIDLRWDACAYCGEAGYARRGVPKVFQHASWPVPTSAPAGDTTQATASARHDASTFWVPASVAMATVDSHPVNGTIDGDTVASPDLTASRGRGQDSGPRPDGSDS